MPRSIVFPSALAILGFAFVLSASEKPPAAEPVDFKKLVAEWREKAERYLKDLKTYPKIDPDLAAKYSGKFAHDELLKTMIAPIDPRNSEMDAFLKRNLLMMQPDFAAHPALTIALIQNMPKLKPVPAPSRDLRKMLDEGTSKVIPEKRIRPIVDKYNETATGQNSQNFIYREELIAALPEDNAIRMYAWIRDFQDRFDANEGSAHRVRDDGIKYAQTYWEARKPVPPRLRDEMLSILNKLQEQHEKQEVRDVVNRAELEANGRVRLHTRGWIYPKDKHQDYSQYVSTTKPAS